MPFLIFLKGRWKASWLFLSILPYLLLFPLRIISRQAAKEKILTRFLRGMPIQVLREKADKYVALRLGRLVHPEAVRAIQWHQQQGHRCVIVSASIDLYLDPWANQMGFDGVLGSRLEVDSHGLVTGKLNGENCWGEEKVHRLMEWLGGKKDVYLYAYGDSCGDHAMLAFADNPHYQGVMSNDSLSESPKDD